MLKSLEELVTESRLDQIAREHKSIGAILDKRQVFPLEEVPRKLQRDDLDRKGNIRRGGKAEVDILSQTNLALESFKEKGINVKLLTGNYEMEEKIWKDKISKPSYFEQRKYKYPHIEEFFQSLSSQQLVEFKEKLSERLVSFAEACRSKCKSLKFDMDVKGIFHPEANAHRVHCIYLMMLYKGICCDNIEDVVLQKMYKELPADCDLAADVKLNVDNQNLSASSYVKRIAPVAKLNDSMLLKKVTDSSNRKVIRIAEYTKPQNLKKCMSQPIKLEPLSKPIGQQSSPTKRISFEFNPKHDVVDKIKTKNSKVEIEDDNTSSKAGMSPLKIFSKKLKHEKMGYMDSRMVLPDEAKRLESGEEVQIKKPRDKSNLLEEKLSTWMLQEIQSKEANKTGVGATATPALKNSIRNQPLAIDDNVLHPVGNGKYSKSMNDFNSTLNAYSPQKVLPFEEFYTLIQKYSTSQNLPSGDNSISQEIAGLKSPSKRNAKLTNNEYKVVQDQLLGDEDGVELETGNLETANLLKHLLDKDDKFDAFLKVSENEQLSSKLLTKLSNNSGLMKEKKARRIAPLGKDAINLTDSRGQASKHAKKGFRNVFKTIEVVSGNEIHTGRMNSKETDVLDRLQYDEDHFSVSSNTSNNIMDHKGGDTESPRSSGGLVGVKQSSKWRSLSRSSIRSKPKQYDNMDSTINCSRESELYGNFRDDINSVPSDMDCDVQNKLMAIWETLRIPAQTRLAFMSKYSTQVYAAEMGHAVDVWGSAAVLCTLLVECIILLKKIQDGLMVFPIEYFDILKIVVGKVHPLLSSTSSTLVPPTTLFYDSKALPYSATILAKVRQQIRHRINLYYEDQRNYFMKPIVNNESTVLSTSDGCNILSYLLVDISSELLEVLKCASQELDDVIPYGEKTCREWLQSCGINSHNPQ